jgi:uncharacterized protein YecT (DUF1311 family)
MCSSAVFAFNSYRADSRADAGGDQCAGARGVCAQADAELNKTYEALLTKLPGAESKQKLKESQRAWLAFRDAEAAFVADHARGGSMAPTTRYETMTELTQQRIKQLKSHIEE